MWDLTQASVVSQVHTPTANLRFSTNKTDTVTIALPLLSTSSAQNEAKPVTSGARIRTTSTWNQDFFLGLLIHVHFFKIDCRPFFLNWGAEWICTVLITIPKRVGTKSTSDKKKVVNNCGAISLRPTVQKRRFCSFNQPFCRENDKHKFISKRAVGSYGSV